MSLSIRIQTTLNTFYLFYTAILQITKEIFVKICWQLKTPTPTWKCTRCIMQMSYLYASAFLSKTFANSLNMQEQYVWEKSNEAYPLSIRVQTTKPHFDLFLPGMNVKEYVFFLQKASSKRHCVTHWCEKRGVNSYQQWQIVVKLYHSFV